MYNSCKYYISSVKKTLKHLKKNKEYAFIFHFKKSNMRQTGSRSDNIESYDSSKQKSFNNNLNCLEAQLNNISTSSLKLEDKKLLLLKMKQIIETDIVTKFDKY